MKKQLIRLTEEDLSNIIESTMKRIISENEDNEGMWDSLKSFAGQYGKRGKENAQALGKRAGEGIKNSYNNAKNAVSNGYNNAKNAVSNGYNNVKQDIHNTWQGAQRDGSMKDMQRAFANFEAAVNKFVQNGGKLNPQMNSRISGIKKVLGSYQPNY